MIDDGEREKRTGEAMRRDEADGMRSTSDFFFRSTVWLLLDDECES
jgi:hypothetical protein